MDQFFSPDLKILIAKSRLIAIDLGYDYISTIHFLLADCESGRPNSIFNFAFGDRGEYLQFKEEWKVKEEDRPVVIEDSLPLTKEAESAIVNTDVERIIHQQTLSYPSHLFLSALSNEKSLLAGLLR